MLSWLNKYKSSFFAFNGFFLILEANLDNIFGNKLHPLAFSRFTTSLKFFTLKAK